MTEPVLPIDDLLDFEPLVGRALATDAGTFVRLRASTTQIAGFVRLPYDVIAGRTLQRRTAGAGFDVTFAASDFQSWLVEARAALGAVSEPHGGQPARRDAHWLTALPPQNGWRRINMVPADTIRELVRVGANIAEGITQKTQQDSLLSSTVLSASPETAGAGNAGARDGMPAASVSAASAPVDVPLRAIAALTKMGFLPVGSTAAVDSAPGWLRLAAEYGSTFVPTGSTLFSLTAS